MDLDIMAEVIGARGVWISRHIGKSPSKITLSTGAEIALLAHLNFSPTGKKFGGDITTCHGRKLHGMDVSVNSDQKDLIRISQ